MERQTEERSSTIKRLTTPAYNLFTAFPQELWKMRHPLVRRTILKALAVPLVLPLLVPLSCTYLKGTVKSWQAPRAATTVAAPGPTSPDGSLVGLAEEEVRKKLGEPTRISRTPENHIIWVYRPPWKLLPNDKGTRYVEFVDGKAIRAFQIQ
jgi:hypothetical protein